MKKDIDQEAIANLRKRYQLHTLELESVADDPFRQFQTWFQEALEAMGSREPNAMTLATASAAGIPSARIVLLKGFSEEGFAFYTNYESQKGKELAENPNAAIVFFWPQLERQVRICGKVEKMTHQESETYFQSRPKASQMGAAASPQSQVIPNRKFLEENLENLTEQYENEAVLPCPLHWGGYRLIPTSLEFWQGRPSRLHDRVRYVLEGKAWKIERLAP